MQQRSHAHRFPFGDVDVVKKAVDRRADLDERLIGRADAGENRLYPP
ncbi:MAG TPA: hypothetical protein VI072_32155 [Polyangiaceae bacterium]